MAEPKPADSARTTTSTTGLWRSYTFFFSVLLPVAAAVILYRLEPFDPAPLPLHELTPRPPAAALLNGRMLRHSERIGEGLLLAPEDIVYDPESGLIYATCMDGWIKRVRVNESVVGESVVENWVYVGGRPLGVALGHKREVIVAHPDKGLLSISRDGVVVEVLTDEAEGVKFKLTDGVDVAHDGTIYFTDASHKYNFSRHMFDILEGRPYGRLLSYHPSTARTQVLLRHLYFANGVAVSPDQNSLLFCETPMRRCRKFYIRGERKGRVERFIDMRAAPDNIKYDGEGHYWIALATEITPLWEVLFGNPWMRKVAAMMEKYTGRPHLEKNGGVLGVDLEGNPTHHYYDPALAFISSGLKIGNRLYCGSIIYPYLISVNLITPPPQHPIS